MRSGRIMQSVVLKMNMLSNKRQSEVCGGAVVSVKDWKRQNEILNEWNNDVCSGNSIPEVEIISLLEEQIPKYKLRADTLTAFGGYENQDWFIPSPALQVEEADLKLSPDQIRETLNYFLLCSNRVSQMTRTYDDIEAVSRLLEEKEKDLELTAKIGKELLDQNVKYKSTVKALQDELQVANEKITQLTHENASKSDLISILTNDMDESIVSESEVSTGQVSLETLQKKIGTLEKQNKSLKTEYEQLIEQTDDVESREKSLLSEMLGELSCANSSVGYLEDEINKTKEENRIQHEEIETLKSKLAETENKLRKTLLENEETSQLLQITKDNQNALAIELMEVKSQYLEIQRLLQDAQEQLRKARRKNTPTVRSSLYSSLNTNYQTPFENLHNELEQSMYSECSLDSGISGDSMPYYKKVFDTIRYASHSSLSSSDSMTNLNYGQGGHTTSTSLAGGPRLSARPQSCKYRRASSSIYSGSSLGYPSLDSTGHSDNESCQTDSEDGYPGPPKPGIPGVPGAADLEAALRRLSPSEVLTRRTNLQFGPAYGGYEGDSYLHYGCRTPDSLMSTGSSNYQNWKLPEKLQIVKPLEGSQTLGQWSQLARPTFEGLLEERPGVKIRCGKELEELGLETYALSDLEEDDEYSNPGKAFESSAPIYTLTNSMVMHPDDGTFAVSSVCSSRVASTCSSIQNSPPPTPKTHSRRNSTSTYSTNYGLAKMLNERGIKAITPSKYNTPCGINSFTPTATPCNSPDSSPNSSRCTSPEPETLLSFPQRIFNSVPQFFQSSSSSEGAIKKRSTSKVKEKTKHNEEKLVNKLERMGVSSLMAAPSALTLSAGMYARPDLTSPMAQLTCLLPNNQIDKGASRSEIHTNKSQSPPIAALGVPAKPGGDALKKRLEQLNARKNRKQGTGGVRADLGTVNFNKKSQEPEQTSSLGTLSSLLFGRKGGLF